MVDIDVYIGNEERQTLCVCAVCTTCSVEYDCSSLHGCT